MIGGFCDRRFWYFVVVIVSDIRNFVYYIIKILQGQCRYLQRKTGDDYENTE